MTRLMHEFPHRPTPGPNWRQAPFYTAMTERDGHFHDFLPNTDPLGWVTERRPGRQYADLIGELIWRPDGLRAQRLYHCRSPTLRRLRHPL
jgi:hypothetical protein